MFKDAHPHKSLVPWLLHCRIEAIEDSLVNFVEHTGFDHRRNYFYCGLVSTGLSQLNVEGIRRRRLDESIIRWDSGERRGKLTNPYCAIVISKLLPE